MLIDIRRFRSPLFICFTVLDDQAKAMGGPRPARKTFAARLSRYFAQADVPVTHNGDAVSDLFALAPGLIDPDLGGLVTLANAPRAHGRIQFQSFTLAADATGQPLDWRKLSPDQAERFGRLHMRLTELVIAWQETEDVDAAAFQHHMPADAKPIAFLTGDDDAPQARDDA